MGEQRTDSKKREPDINTVKYLHNMIMLLPMFVVVFEYFQLDQLLLF